MLLLSHHYLQMIIRHILDLEPSPRPHALDTHVFLSAMRNAHVSRRHSKICEERTHSSRILIIGSPPGSIGFRKMTFCLYSAVTILAPCKKRER
jgi:hypothetical protein